jgi:hypothetical protein
MAIKHRTSCGAQAAGRRKAVAPRMTDGQCEALFVSQLQGSDDVTPEVTETAITCAIRQLGTDGCACRVAQEFGDHPEEARDRMRWARHLIGEMLSDPAAHEARCAA